jgi:hypothetical protein
MDSTSIAGNGVAYATCYALQIPRLLAEERFLARDPAYAAYLERVRWRLVPSVYQYCRWSRWFMKSF